VAPLDIGDEGMSKRADVQIQPNCEDDFEPALLSVETALERITAMVEPLAEIERTPLREALGRVLAEDLRSPVDVPNHTNAAMGVCRSGRGSVATNPYRNRHRLGGTSIR